MAEKTKTLSLLDLKGKMSFVDGYDYRSFRVLKIDVSDIMQEVFNEL